MPWWDYFLTWAYAMREDPFSERMRRIQLTGAGVTQPDAIPDVRQGGEFWSGSKGVIRLREGNDFVDLSSVQNRISRYKEYERLRNISEIETVMQVFADESCVAGHTKIATLEYGPKEISWLTENKAGQRFAVYCWDFEKNDFTVGWAYDPRVVKEDETLRIKFDDGSSEVTTADHRFLLRTGEWCEAQHLEFGAEVMAFYRIRPQQLLTKQKQRQFPRIYTHRDGWKHERWFIDEWRSGDKDEHLKELSSIIRTIGGGLNKEQVEKAIGHKWETAKRWLDKEGFSFQEIRALYKKKDRRRVIDIEPWKKQKVYDLSVEKHENFCTDSCVLHNCQKNDDGHVIEIECNNKKVKEELEFLFYHRDMLNVNRRMWSWAKNLFIFGDFFLELIMNPDNPKDGILKVLPLPPESMFRIETTKGKIVEFQQTKEGPDFQALTRAPVTQATEAELMQSTALRFHPDQVVHMRIGEDRRTFYPYGVSLIEAARGPAHQLRLMEDAMVVYRLTRAPERRVFYIDVGQLPPFKAEAFMERMKDLLRKKKVSNSRNQLGGASGVEERWHAPAQDEDFWVPIRPNTNTRIETLPGAQNLGEIDDAVYFRNKLYTALQFPKNYLTQEDPSQTRITLSVQDVKFARTVERLQSPMEDGMMEIARRHLVLRGFPEEHYDDLKIKLTAPSDWRELSRAEVITNRLNNANNLKGSQMMPDYDIYIDWLKIPEEEALEKLSRLKIQKLEDLKLQVLASNPQLLGVGQPGQGEQEIGSEIGGPNPMLGPGGPGGPGAPGAPGAPPGPGGPGAPPGGPMGPEGAMGAGGPPGGPGGPEGAMGAGGPEAMAATPPGGPMGPEGAMGAMGPEAPGEEMAPKGPQPGAAAQPLPDPSDDDIKKYDMGIQDYESEMDAEDVDYSEA